METTKIRCTCSCHQPGIMMMHIKACCNNGWIEQPFEKQYVKDGDFFKYYYEEIGWITEQHSELYSGKIEINPDWEVLQESIGTIYVVNKKSKDGE